MKEVMFVIPITSILGKLPVVLVGDSAHVAAVSASRGGGGGCWRCQPEHAAAVGPRGGQEGLLRLAQ